MTETPQRTVLIVDDDATTLAGLTRICRKEPYRTLVARDATAALEVLKSTSVDVVVADEMMPPGVSGTEFLAQVRKDYPHIARIILTAVTAPWVPEDRMAAAGAMHVLAKPCDPNVFRDSLRQALGIEPDRRSGDRSPPR